jgi:phosphoadenosine phosphosulfate reductase
LESLPPHRLLEWALQTYSNRFAVVTSFQSEGMAILDMAWRIDPNVRVITLDTGRLPAETHHIIEAIRERYGIRVEVVSPDAAEVEAMVTRHGPNLFRNSVSARLLCCQVRKVRPLNRKLREFQAWAAGVRREQTEARADTPKIQRDGDLIKLSPVADWSAGQVEEYLAGHDVPRHPLYAAGYASIGCAPCTRALAPGEQERAGRWWWESGAEKECGLHFTPDGRARREVDVLLEEVLEAAGAA